LNSEVKSKVAVEGDSPSNLSFLHKYTFIEKEKHLQFCFQKHLQYKDLLRDQANGKLVDKQLLADLANTSKQAIITVEIKRPWWYPLSLYLADQSK